MNCRTHRLCAITLFTVFALGLEARVWTLSDCLDYAREHNITLKKAALNTQSAHEDLLQSKAELLPSLSFNTSQNVNHRPWPEKGVAMVAGGNVQSHVKKTYYNGSYNLNASWNLYNGNQNRNNVRLNSVREKQQEAQYDIQKLGLEEQIAQLFVEILYSTEAIDVAKSSLLSSQKIEERGNAMLQVGKMSRADVAQLTAERAQDEYNVVALESNLKEFKRQMKELLQLATEEEFDVTSPAAADELALQSVPAMSDVYAAALENRPEIRNAQLSKVSGDLNLKIAKAMRVPTVGLNGSLSTSTSSMSDNAWGKQMKTNFDAGIGVSVSVPIFDNRSARTAINKAKIQQQTALLDLEEEKTALFSKIENYWTAAITAQSKFKASQVSAQCQRESFDKLSEQFRLGLKNIVELLKGKDSLLQAEQNALENKYQTILNLNLLEFYRSGVLKK